MKQNMYFDDRKSSPFVLLWKLFAGFHCCDDLFSLMSSNSLSLNGVLQSLWSLVPSTDSLRDPHWGSGLIILLILLLFRTEILIKIQEYFKRNSARSMNIFGIDSSRQEQSVSTSEVIDAVFTWTQKCSVTLRTWALSVLINVLICGSNNKTLF